MNFVEEVDTAHLDTLWAFLHVAMQSLEDSHSRQVLPEHHLARVDDERPQEANDAIAEDGGRERRENSGRSLDVRVVIEPLDGEVQYSCIGRASAPSSPRKVGRLT